MNKMSRSNINAFCMLCVYLALTIINLLICFKILVPALGISDTSVNVNIVSQIFFAAVTVITMIFLHNSLSFLYGIENKYKLLLLFVFNLYMAFSLSASRIFFEYGFSINTVFNFICIFIWCAPVALLMISILHKVSAINFSVKINSKSSYVIYGVSFVIFCLASGFMLFLFYPGFSSQDTLNQFNQALGIVPITNWQTPFHTLTIRALLSIINNPAFVVVCQFVFFACVFSSGVRYLYLIGVKPIILFTFLAFFILSPTNLVLINTIWKDIPYAANIMWITIIICKIIKPTNAYSSIYTKYLFYAEVCLSMICVSLLRQNGFVVAVISSIVIVMLSSKKWKMTATIAISAIAVLLFTGPFYAYMNIEEVEENLNGEYLGLAQDIIGVKVYGGDLSETGEYIVNTLIDGNENYVYRPSSARSPGIENLDISMLEFIREYILTFINNPKLMTKAILQRNWLMWDLTTTPGGHIGTLAYMDTMDDYDADNYGVEYLDWLEMSPQSEENIPWMSSLMRTIVELTTKVPFVWLFWRVGIYTLIMLACIIVLLYKKKQKLIMVFTPVIAQMISIILSTGWADYRYFWPCTFCVIYGMIFIIFGNSSKKYAPEEQKTKESH